MRLEYLKTIVCLVCLICVDRSQDDFSIDQVHPVGKQIAQNWIFKVSCIRELIPRIFIEIAIIESNRFLVGTDIPATLARICGTIRGIGDPTISIYARAFVVYQSLKLAKILKSGEWAREIMMSAFEDSMDLKFSQEGS